LSGDAAIGLVSALGISAGVILASVGGGYNVDLLSYLFGNILSISREEVIIAGLLCVGVIVLLSLYYNELFAIAFSDELARVSGVHASYINAILVLLTALSVVLAMKLVGIMLISSMLIVPAASALQLARGFKVCIVLAAVQGCSSVIIGIIISIMSNLPASATIVMVNLLLFAVAFLTRRIIYPKNSN
jgi:zinc transport system permease protein